MGTYIFDAYTENPEDSGFPTYTTTFVYAPVSGTTIDIVLTDDEANSDGLVFTDNVTGNKEEAIITFTDPDTGVTYTDIPINADKGWTLYDPETGQTFEVVTLHAKQGSVSYKFTLSEYPLEPGKTYEVLSYDAHPDPGDPTSPVFTYDEYVCFTAGARLRVPGGWRAVESLRPGDLVETRDRGARPLVWCGMRRVIAGPDESPIRIAPGVLGNARELRVSPQHRMLVAGWACELLFGDSEVFVAAKDLLELPGVSRAGPGPVTYVHVMLGRHEVLDCEGAGAESFHPGEQGMMRLCEIDVARMARAVPRLSAGLGAYGPTARRVLRGVEATALVGGYAPAIATPAEDIPSRAA